MDCISEVELSALRIDFPRMKKSHAVKDERFCLLPGIEVLDLVLLAVTVTCDTVQTVDSAPRGSSQIQVNVRSALSSRLITPRPRRKWKVGQGETVNRRLAVH